MRGGLTVKKGRCGSEAFCFRFIKRLSMIKWDHEIVQSEF